MSNLKEMQSLFQGAVMGNETEFLSEIENGGKISPERRLNIYQHAYKSRLREVLAEDFPVIHILVGDDVFLELCNDYIDAYPSSHPSLRFFGQNFEKFTRQVSPYKEQSIIGEMAQFEWAFHNVFDAKDHDYVTIEDVAALAPEVWTTLRFDVHPSLYIAPYAWNVAAVWSSVQEEGAQSIMPEAVPGGCHIIQWRRNLLSYYRTLTSDEGEALMLAMEGKSFPEICESLAVIYTDDAPAKAADYLREWVDEGLVASLQYLDLNI